jgi:hypothetical protein
LPLKFCVYNPMTGAARVLPPLTGKDGVGHFACTVLTADDYQYQVQDGVAITPPPPRLSSPHYRLLVLYNRRDFTAIRSYSSKDGSWSPERRVTGAQLGKRQMRLTRGGVVAGGAQRVVLVHDGRRVRAAPRYAGSDDGEPAYAGRSPSLHDPEHRAGHDAGGEALRRPVWLAVSPAGAGW